MADLANLVLAVDSTQVKTGTAALDGLTAAGSRAEAATVGMGAGFKGVGAEAAAMASAAQLSARAAVDQAAGFGASTSAARLNTLAMRETLVVAREISRGNFTRLPGSLTLLAQGIGSGGGLSAYAQALGLIKKVGDAELEEQAIASKSAADAIRNAATRAGANILAADTEIALAEAQLRVADGSTAEAAAQQRLAGAHQASALAADEARAAENALAVAQGRAIDAETQAAARRTTVLGRFGTVAGIAAVAVLGAEGAFKALQATVDDNGSLDRYAASLVKTKDQLKDLEDKVGGFQITWGDVFHGVSKAISDALDTSDAWEKFKEDNRAGFTLLLHNAIDTMGGVYGVFRGTYQTIVDDWSKLPAAFGDAFYSAVNAAIGALNKLVQYGAGQLNTLIASVSKLTGFNLGSVSAPQIGAVGNPYSGAAAAVGHDLSGNVSKYSAQGRAALQGAANTVYDDIVGAARDRIKGGLPKAKKGRTKKAPKQPVDHADDTIARLDEQILAAKIALTKDATEEAALKVQELNVQRDKTIADAQSLLNTHKITQSEFDTIKLRAQELDNLKEKAVLNARDVALLKEDQARRDQLSDFATEDLKFANDNATTQAEHRSIQLQMLDVAYRKLALDLESEKDQALINGATKAQLALIQDRIDRLPTQEGYAKAAVVKQTQDPLQAWLDSVKTTGPEITEALQSIEVKGFDSLAQGIAGVITGTESLGKVFKDISSQIIGDIVQMTVKMLIFRAIGGIFGGGGYSAGSLGAGIGGDFSSTLLGSIPHFANGGSMIIGGNSGVDNNVLSLNGSPVAMVGKGETLGVYPNRPQASNNNQPQVIELHVVTDENFSASVQQISGTQLVQVVPQIIAQATKSTTKMLMRPSISGGR